MALEPLLFINQSDLPGCVWVVHLSATCPQSRLILGMLPGPAPYSHLVSEWLGLALRVASFFEEVDSVDLFWIWDHRCPPSVSSGWHLLLLRDDPPTLSFPLSSSLPSPPFPSFFPLFLLFIKGEVCFSFWSYFIEEDASSPPPRQKQKLYQLWTAGGSAHFERYPWGRSLTFFSSASHGT